MENTPVRTLPTWRGKSQFSYEGSVTTGTQLHFGSEGRFLVCRAHYAALTRHFFGKTVEIGTSRTDPPEGSLGEWLQKNVIRTAIASYVGPILLAEGFAERAPGRPTQIRIVKTLDCP